MKKWRVSLQGVRAGGWAGVGVGDLSGFEGFSLAVHGRPSQAVEFVFTGSCPQSSGSDHS